MANHAADPAEFMRRMDAGPAHLVTLSSGGIFGALAHCRSQDTLPYVALTDQVVARCIPDSRLVIIPEATHLMSRQNPAAFDETLLQFLAQH